MKGRSNISSIVKGDKVIWAVVIALSIFSMFVVYSSTATLAFNQRSGNTEYYLIKHAVVLAFGYLALITCYFLNYKKYATLSNLLLPISFLLLVYTLIRGTNLNNAARWIQIPFVGLTFQTSDLAKVALILFVSKEIAKKQDDIKSWKTFIWLNVPILVICLLIAIADFSTAALLFVTCCLMMIAGRVRWKHIFKLIGLGVVGVGGLISVGYMFPNKMRVFTWISRLNSFLNDVDGPPQVQQAKMAISKAGILGVGPGNGFQRNFLPSAYSDFVYAFIVEEWGLIGAFAVLMTYLILLWRGIKLITKSDRTFGSMLVLGMTLLIVLQALINMAVSVHLVPVTGLPLPLISHGGTSVIFTCIALGVILCVSKYVEKPQLATDGAIENEIKVEGE